MGSYDDDHSCNMGLMMMMMNGLIWIRPSDPK